MYLHKHYKGKKAGDTGIANMIKEDYEGIYTYVTHLYL